MGAPTLAARHPGVGACGDVSELQPASRDDAADVHRERACCVAWWVGRGEGKRESQGRAGRGPMPVG